MSIPILIPTFNNITYLRRMVLQLKAHKLGNIIVVDNASTAPDMLSYLDEIEHEVIVVKLDYNAGPRALFLTQEYYACLPDVFCITDPDLEFSNALPSGFLLELINATEIFKIGKAGFALDISQPELMREGVLTATFVDDVGVKYVGGVIEWESRFWQHQIATTAGGDPIYLAPIDTTFAVYNKRYFSPETYLHAVRFAGKYTARHLPWYKENGLSLTEEQYYRSTSKWSCNYA
jgi:glycosyltransferase involved in cell wall biosynthesis